MQNVQPGKSPIALRPRAAVGLLPSVSSLVSLEVGTLCVNLEKLLLIFKSLSIMIFWSIIQIRFKPRNGTKDLWHILFGHLTQTFLNPSR